jgi:hypothetical protein
MRNSKKVNACLLLLLQPKPNSKQLKMKFIPLFALLVFVNSFTSCKKKTTPEPEPEPDVAEMVFVGKL